MTDPLELSATAPGPRRPGRRHRRRKAQAVAKSAHPAATNETPRPERRNRRKSDVPPSPPVVAASEPELIVLPARPSAALPALPPTGPAAAPEPSASPLVGPGAIPAKRGDDTEEAAPAVVTHAGTGGLLPEYRSQTNGLRELLSSISPLDGDYAPATSYSGLEPIEDGMHIPYNRPGVPGSPDLPVSPARFLHFLGNGLLAVFLVALGGLVYSYFASPQGINWNAVEETAGAASRWATAQSKPAAQATVPIDDPLSDSRTTLATTGRISTTSARAKVDIAAGTAAADLDISAGELERRIREIEASAVPAASVPRTLHSDSARSDADLPQATAAETEALRATRIDPEMEQQIFSRAKAYLKQRDIASARMVLNYAASLGSGIAAMALAETYDPAHVGRIRLQRSDASPTEARRWYQTAAGLGISEAEARLEGLE